MPRRGGEGASIASQGGDEDDEGHQHGKEEEAEQALSRRQHSAESAASAAASSSSAAAGLAPSAASLLQAAEGKMVICDAVRLQYQERVAASAKVRRWALLHYLTFVCWYIYVSDDESRTPHLTGRARHARGVLRPSQGHRLPPPAPKPGRGPRPLHPQPPGGAQVRYVLNLLLDCDSL